MKQMKNAAVAALMAALALLAAGSASATTLETSGSTWNGSVFLDLSLTSGTSSVISDTFGISANTCASSVIRGDTNSSTNAEGKVTNLSYTGVTLTGDVDKLEFYGCSDPVTVHFPGDFHISHIAGTTNGTVTSSGAEFTADGPFGYLNCKTGTGAHLGVLTGVASMFMHARLHVNAVLDCGLSSRWTANYTVTGTTGLGVSA